MTLEHISMAKKYLIEFQDCFDIVPSKKYFFNYIILHKKQYYKEYKKCAAHEHKQPE